MHVVRLNDMMDVTRPYLLFTLGEDIMAPNLARHIVGIAVGMVLFAGTGLAAEPAEVEKFVKARIEIGEMMTNYFSGGERFKEGQRPSSEQMREMGADINAKLSTLLAKHDLTPEEYRKRSPEVFADDTAVKNYLNEHPDLKQRYDALPLDRMGRGGSTGRGY
jgi:hypothetical protein